ncbi:MAG: 6-carboxytetrahydropterin synthase [Nitrospirae bacterium]|nr:6-carboxytetrahydropterin synthase [Nitrospirota bacterium]MBI3593586.1 6-carboxytetrahydropterin synthase [Nitrospirota bacterium]
MGLLYITKRIEFSSSHFLADPRQEKEMNLSQFGKEMNTHGHNYLLELTLEGAIDPVTGMVINTVELKERMLHLLEEFDHRHLNLDLPYFKEKLPTVDHIAHTLGDLFQERNRDLSLSRVRLYENEESFADYHLSSKIKPVAPSLVYHTQVFRFSSAHRLHSKQLSDAENRRIYGKCNNPNSHGHNYVLYVTLEGPPDPQTGSLLGIEKSHQFIRRDISDRYDHHYLDQDFDEFKENVSTAENILVIVWNRLFPSLSNRLYKLKLIETRDNYFEYFG